jgi:acetyl-CoA C-acetyltransferase
MSDVVIVAAKRTAIGSFNGVFSAVTAPQLAAAAIKATLADSGVGAAEVEEALIGCVLSAGVGQAPARQAALGAGLSLGTTCTTVSKVCGSGMRAAMLAFDAIKAGSAKVVIAGGMESMTNAPYLLPKARSGYRFGHGEVLDHMALDGLQNAADRKAMGEFAEICVSKYSFSREEQDAFASESVKRANAAIQSGAFAAEIAPVTVAGRKGDVVVQSDEEPPLCDLSKVSSLRPAFKKDGSVTAASSSKISDGAAALLMMSSEEAARRGLKPLARVVAHQSHAQEPEWFTTAPVGAIQKLQAKIGWSNEQVDLYEINEAFAVVAMAAIRDCALDPSKVNVNGGACALGHPIGCTGARILVTLLHALKARGGKRGIASLCIGGGEATAMAIEML